GCSRGVRSPSSFSNRNGDRLTQSLAGLVQIVTQLQRELVRARRQLHVDFGFAVAEMHPCRRAFYDRGSRRQAVLIDADVMMTDARPRGFHGSLRYRSELIVLDAELEMHWTLDRRAVLRLLEEHARFAGRRSRRFLRRFARSACADGDERGQQR